MCGICFICGFSEEEIEKLLSSTERLISHRGPDCYQKTDLKIEELKVVFQASVLWLQGCELSPQPFVDVQGNILLWNGDILAGYEIPKNVSDTKYISDSLASKDEEEKVLFLSKIKGPWAFIYYAKHINRLYFGRDVFGRHSLLWKLPSEEEGTLMITSVCHRNKHVKEVPSLGLYYIDLGVSEVMNNFSVKLIPWNHISEENLHSLDPVIRVVNSRIESPVLNSLKFCVPDDSTLELLKSLPTTLENDSTAELYSFMSSHVDDLLDVLRNSIKRRCDKCPQKCLNCTKSEIRCDHSKIAVLFSGGLDSAMIALLLDSCLDRSESIDLLNVAFAQASANQSNCKNSKRKGKPKNIISETDNIISETDNSVQMDYEVPDRKTGRDCWLQLQEIRPERKWNFVEINVTGEELAEERESNICHLVSPLYSVLDDSIGCALWFGGRGKGFVQGVQYTSPARVLLCGMGADEQLGGYSRHRIRFGAGGWPALLEEIDMEISRIHTRNLGRDNRILSDHGRAPRFPYLDEDVVTYLNDLPIWLKANLTMPRGMGEKFILRVAAAHLGLTIAAGLPKRAIQFGSRIAKLENSKEKGSDSCSRLMEN